MDLKINDEFRKLIPPLTKDEYEQLEENILEEGCRDAIVLWNGVILDGHNRYDICTKHNIAYNVLEKNFDNDYDAKIWIINNQFARRNITPYQRSVLALQLEPLIAEKAKENQIRKPMDSVLQKSAKQTIDTREEVAKLASVSHDTIAKVKFIETQATPEIINKVSSGKISINQAYKDVKKEVEKQQKEIEKEHVNKKLSDSNNTDIEITDIQPGWHKLGRHYLYYGNNTDSAFIDFLPKSRLAFADPPYNASVDEWDNDFEWQQDYLQDVADIVAVTPGGWNACEFYKKTNMTYIWELSCWIKNGMTHGRCGYANWIKTSIFGKGKVKIDQDFWSIAIKPSETEDTRHKGRKPYDYMYWILDTFTKENEIIIDPFAGSGTTLIMSEAMNRICYTAEIDKEFCLDIIKRCMSKGLKYDRF